MAFEGHEVQLVTELMPAGDLWSALREGRVSWYHGGREIALHVAAGLHYLHSKRVIHLDLKPSNILLRGQPGAPPQGAKITDVGLAKVAPTSAKYSNAPTLSNAFEFDSSTRESGGGVKPAALILITACCITAQ